MTARFRIEALADHDRSTFSSGVEALDGYFHKQVTQDIRRRVTACFVAVEQDNAQVSEGVAGFYTLAASGLRLSDLPPELAKKLPRYPTVPAVRMGRLAVAAGWRGQGLGAALLADAMLRALSNEIAAFALVVDAKDDKVAAFYQHHGFIAFADQPLTLFLPLETAARMLKR